MKIQQMIRMQVAMVGVAAGLFLASAAPAQEISNTEWPDRAGATESVAALQQPTAESAKAAPASQPVATQDAAATKSAVGSETVAFLLVGIFGVVLYAQTGKKRAGYQVDGGDAEIGRSASLS